jgi:hypothetical protein
MGLSVVYESFSSYKITKSEITLVISKANAITSEWFNLFSSSFRLGYEKQSNNFTFAWVSNEFSSVTLEVYTVNNSIFRDQLYETKTVTSGTSLSINVDNTTGQSYEAKAYAQINGVRTYLGSLRVDGTFTPQEFEDSGWIIAAIVLIVISFMGLWNPQIMMLMMGFSIIILKLINIIPISWTVIYALLGLLGFMMFLMSDKS